MNVEQKSTDQDSKKIFTMLILVVTLVICTTSATYAYFAIGASAVNNITGTAASASLILTNSTSVNATTNEPPQLIAPATATYNTLPMVPQISYTGTTNVLQSALNGATGKDKCVDDNGNVICRAYTFVVKNLSSAAVDVRGSITFSYGAGSTFNNLRWKLMSSATAVTVSSSTASTTFSTTDPIKASTSKVYFDTSNVDLTSNGGYKQYWLIVWIEEIGEDQGAGASIAKRDVGTWYATIQFEAFNETNTAIGGITSTITGTS